MQDKTIQQLRQQLVIAQQEKIDSRIALGRSLQELCADKQNIPLSAFPPFAVTRYASNETQLKEAQERILLLVRKLESLRADPHVSPARRNDSTQVELGDTVAHMYATSDDRQVQSMDVVLTGSDVAPESGSYAIVTTLPPSPPRATKRVDRGSSLICVGVDAATDPSDEGYQNLEEFRRARELRRGTFSRVETSVITQLPSLLDADGRVSLADIIRMDRQPLLPQRLCTVRYTPEGIVIIRPTMASHHRPWEIM